MEFIHSNSFETAGDSAGPSLLTISDRRRAAHRDLVKRGAGEPEHNRTGRRKHARGEHSQADSSSSAQLDAEVAGSSVLQPEGDEYEFNLDDINNEFNPDDNGFDGHQHYEPKQPVPDPSGESQPATNPADVEHSHSHEDPPPRSPPPPDPDPARYEDADQPPQQNLDQRARIDVDIDELERLAVLPKQKDAIAFIRALQNASLDDLCAKLNDAALQCL
ncbi:hypothetical protein DFH29DRAFT_1010478 [Suillus ampliporus]|nr:hypothetical protein DFH29DRAFT_1010478 [Suillus ampliporus]